MVYSPKEIVERALASKAFPKNQCQKWTRTMIGAPSAGDLDGDGDADAVDGWLSEPDWAKHHLDRNPPEGAPVAFSGGSAGYGHRAISLGDGKIRSTDMNGSRYAPGVVGTTTIEAIEARMGVHYLGWSETMTGLKIPDLIPPKPPAKKTRGARIDKAIRLLNQANAKSGSARAKAIRKALAAAKEIPFLKN